MRRDHSLCNPLPFYPLLSPPPLTPCSMQAITGHHSEYKIGGGERRKGRERMPWKMTKAAESKSQTDFYLLQVQTAADSSLHETSRGAVKAVVCERWSWLFLSLVQQSKQEHYPQKNNALIIPNHYTHARVHTHKHTHTCTPGGHYCMIAGAGSVSLSW